MKENALVIDLDNTIIDTAVRKWAILEATIGPGQPNVSLQKVREDFEMKECLSTDAQRARVFEELNSPKGISDYAAPLVEGAAAALQELKRNNIRIFILTTRVEGLRAATLKELSSNGVNIDDSQLLMYAGRVGAQEPEESAVIEFKRDMLDNVARNWTILAYVGDRPHDALAASLSCVIPILLLSTVTESERSTLRKAVAHMEECSTWREVLDRVKDAKEIMPKLLDLRQIFSSQYGGWLRDIDEKCRITVMIATVLVAISGKQFIEESNNLLKIVLLAALLLSLLAMLYGIRAYTSRHTSGQQASRTVRVALKQRISYLFGAPKQWMYVTGDEIDQLNCMRAADECAQSNAHVAFFVGRYKTLNAETMHNLRLFELRATNYSKLYGERLASQLLMVGVLAMLIWVVTSAIMGASKPHIDQQTRDQIADLTHRLGALQKEINGIEGNVLASQNANQQQVSALGVLTDSLSRLEGKVSSLQREIETMKGEGKALLQSSP